MHTGEEGRREFRSCCGFLHTTLAFKIVIVYYFLWSTVVALTPMPCFNFYIGIAGVIMCVLVLVGVYMKNLQLITMFFYYVVFTICLLLFLGGYYFFVTIFFKEDVRKNFGVWFDDLFFLIHFLDVVFLLIHYYSLGIISKNRSYIWTHSQKNGKVCTIHANEVSSALRSDMDLA